jgi:hypothetical protein
MSHLLMLSKVFTTTVVVSFLFKDFGTEDFDNQLTKVFAMGLLTAFFVSTKMVVAVAKDVLSLASLQFEQKID